MVSFGINGLERVNNMLKYSTYSAQWLMQWITMQAVSSSNLGINSVLLVDKAGNFQVFLQVLPFFLLPLPFACLININTSKKHVADIHYHESGWLQVSVSPRFVLAILSLCPVLFLAAVLHSRNSELVFLSSDWFKDSSCPVRGI